jgi:hypothetical protein
LAESWDAEHLVIFIMVIGLSGINIKTNEEVAIKLVINSSGATQIKAPAIALRN